MIKKNISGNIYNVYDKVKSLMTLSAFSILRGWLHFTCARKPYSKHTKYTQEQSVKLALSKQKYVANRFTLKFV